MSRDFHVTCNCYVHVTCQIASIKPCASTATEQDHETTTVTRGVIEATMRELPRATSKFLVVQACLSWAYCMKHSTKRHGIRKKITRLVGVLHELHPSVNGEDMWHTGTMLRKNGKATTMTTALYAACISRETTSWVQMLYNVCGMITKKQECEEQIRDMIDQFIRFEFIFTDINSHAV